MGLPSPRKDAHRPGGSRTRESPPSRSCPAAVTSWDAPPHPGSPKERKRREGLGPRQAADSAGRWAPLVDVPGQGVLPREPLHPGKLAQGQGRLPLPVAILTVASRLGLGPHSVVAFHTSSCSRRGSRPCRGGGGGEVGYSSLMARLWIARSPHPRVGLARSPSQTAPLSLASAGPRRPAR